MNDIEKLLKLADKASEGNLGTTKISWTINGIAMVGQYSEELPGIYGVGFEYVPGETNENEIYDPAWQRECEAEMQAKREIARHETLEEMNRERKSALDQVFGEFRNIFGGLEE